MKTLLTRASAVAVIGSAWLAVAQPANISKTAPAQTPADRAPRLVLPAAATESADAPLSASTKISFDQLPPAVQKTLRCCSEPTLIESLEKGTRQGQTVYQATFGHAGKDFHLRVVPDGSLLQDPANERALALLKQSPRREAVGRPPAFQTQTGGGSSGQEEADHFKKIDFGQLPIPVMSRLQQEAPTVVIQQLEIGTLDGEPIYRATFQQNGNDVELLIGADGSLPVAPVVRLH